MKILILGAGKMGSFFCDLLSFDHDVAIFDIDPRRLLYTYNVRRLSSDDEIRDFEPDMVINAATVKYTIAAFKRVLPLIPQKCILSDIASVKTGLPEFYAQAGHPYVSTHPMFGPTFASLSNLTEENAVIIKEGCDTGKDFFRKLYTSLRLNIVDYSFNEHDRTIAYSLSIPFASTLVFASVMEHQEAPGTTFKRHMAIARGLMSEDDYLLTEIMFNPYTPERIEAISERIDELKEIVAKRDHEAMNDFLRRTRRNLE